MSAPDQNFTTALCGRTHCDLWPLLSYHAPIQSSDASFVKMPPRLAHKKSKTGCQRCKVRRVKCDEVRPICTSCARHSVTCEYRPIASLANASPSRPPIAARKTKFNNQPPPSAGQAASEEEVEGPEAAFGPNQRRLLELRLLHLFITTVVYTFPSSHTQAGVEVWSVGGVRLAFEHPFLLNAILALAALHVASEPDNGAASASAQGDRTGHPGHLVTSIAGLTSLSYDFADYTKVHEVYLNLVIGQQRDAVANINSGNANAIFLSTILLQYQAFRNSPGRQERTVYSPPLQWLRMAKAITSVAQTARPLIAKDSVMDFMAQQQNEPNLLDAQAIFSSNNYLGNAVFEALLDFERYPEPSLDEDTKHLYERMMGFIGGCWRGILRQEESRVTIRRILALGPLCPARFIEFLEQRRPRALAILAHHFAMAKVVDDHWLFRGFAQREVRGIGGLLPESWQWAMEWPNRVLNGNIPDVLHAAMLPSPEESVDGTEVKNFVRTATNVKCI